MPIIRHRSTNNLILIICERQRSSLLIKMAAISKVILLCIIFTTFLTIVNSARLNVGRLLLPYNQGVPTNYTLEVTGGGCYKWSSSRQEVISITPVEENLDRICTTRVILSAVSPYRDRHSVIVVATDEDTGLTLRCDVTVDVIHSISIVTTTREIFLEDAPVAFEVKAENDQGDTFSCLDGVSFQWIITDRFGKPSENNVLRFLKFADSAFKTPPAIDFWEQQGLHGSKVLLEGVKTGTAKASVRLRDSEYKDLQSSEITLIVVANLVLNPPSDVYILPEMTIQYQVELIKQRKAHIIPMPSDQYYLEISNTEIADLNPATSTVIGYKFGFTQIILKDKNIKSEEILHQPSAGIHVVHPSYILFKVSPGNKWSLQEKTTYIVYIELYDSKHHQIHLSDNINVEVTFPSLHFQISYSSENGTYYVVQTLVPGSCQIQGEIKGIIKNGKLLRILSPVSGYQEVTIYHAVRVSPSVVLLPWNDHIQPKYFVVLKATGGTGSYKWLSSNNSIAKISHEEHLDRIQIVTHTIGNASITAVDLQNSLFTDSAKISIQIVASIKFLNATVETEIGQSVILPLAIYGYESEGRIKMFNNCSEIPIEVDVNLEKFSYSEGTDIVSTGCRALRFTCKAIGYSDIVVQYDTGEGIINATSTIACHKLLQPIYPKQFAVLALGSSMEVAFEGGPRPWPLDLQGHYIQMKTSSSKITEITSFDCQHYHKDVHVARVTCKSIGESMLEVTVGNHPSLKNPLPVENKASIRIMCAVPKSIQLIPKRKEPKGKKYPCQLLETDEKLPVHCYQDLEIELWVKDSLGRKFSNISSLNVHWELSDENLGKLENKMNVITEVTTVGGFRKAIRSIQKLHPFEKEGLLIVKVEIVGYKHDILYRENINVQWNVISTIQQSVILELVNDADIIPDKLSIFNHPSIKNYLNIVQGSGQFYIDMSNNKKAKVQYVKATRKIEIAPLEDGSFTLTVHDMCLEARKTIAAQVQISGISAIRIHMVDKVELGKSFMATLEILDEEGHRLPTSLFPLINLKPILTSNIIAVKSEAMKDDNQYQAFYVITGLSLGHTSVIFTAATDAESSTKTISSESFPIQVFPPLRIEPKNLTLIVGATFQVICSGGPLPQSNVEYSILEQNIASVNTAGIITASKLGKTILTAKAVGQDRKTGHSVVYSQDQVVINVILLKGIKIKAPLTRLEIDTEMPVYAVGITEQEVPFAFGSAFPNLNFNWSVSNQNIVQLRSVFQQNDIQQSNENNFAMRVLAKQAGHITLRLDVSPVELSSGVFSQIIQNSQLSAEVQIEIYERLELLIPEIDNSKILMSPHSQKKLRSNRDGFTRVTYTLLSLHSDPDPDVTVDNTGLLKAGSKTGSIQIVVTSYEDFDVKQCLTVLVEVKLISYLSVGIHTIIKTDSWPLPVIPLGLTMTMEVHFHSDTGRKFNALNTSLKFRPSRCDLIQISQGVQNQTLKVQALKPGLTVLKVWDAINPHLVDYINMIIGIAIDPVETSLTIGDIVCYSSPLVTQEGQHGSWFSTNNVMVIHSITGIAVAQRVGTDTVHYNVSNVLVTNTQVNVKPASVIIIDRAAVKHISNVPREKPYIIPILLRSEANQKMSNLLGKNCSQEVISSASFILNQFPFNCELSLVKPSIDISINDIFQTMIGFDWEKGQYYCGILPINKASFHDISMLNAEVILHIQLLEQTGRQTVQTTAMSTAKTINLPFFPAFHVFLEELVLSNIQPVGTVAVSAISSIQECIAVIPSDSNLLEIRQPKTDSNHPYALMFPVAIRDISSLWQMDVLTASLHLEISCSLTKQMVIIPVKLKLIGLKDGVQCSPVTYNVGGWKSAAQIIWENYQSFMITVLSIIGTIAALFIGYRSLLNSRSQILTTSQPNVFVRSYGESYSPSTSLPYSPWRSTPSGESPHMQNTSRPHLWSVDNRNPGGHSPPIRTLHKSQ